MTDAIDAARWRALLVLDDIAVCDCDNNGHWIPLSTHNVAAMVDAAMKAQQP